SEHGAILMRRRRNQNCPRAGFQTRSRHLTTARRSPPRRPKLMQPKREKSQNANRSDRPTAVFRFSHFVTSMTAPVASGWSVRRVGLAPTGKRRLVTAHTKSGITRRLARHPKTAVGGGSERLLSATTDRIGTAMFLA